MIQLKERDEKEEVEENEKEEEFDPNINIEEEEAAENQEEDIDDAVISIINRPYPIPNDNINDKSIFKSVLSEKQALFDALSDDLKESLLNYIKQ
jgi:hypothetical protein